MCVCVCVFGGRKKREFPPPPFFFLVISRRGRRKRRKKKRKKERKKKGRKERKKERTRTGWRPPAAGPADFIAGAETVGNGRSATRLYRVFLPSFLNSVRALYVPVLTPPVPLPAFLFFHWLYRVTPPVDWPTVVEGAG